MFTFPIHSPTRPVGVDRRVSPTRRWLPRIIPSQINNAAVLLRWVMAGLVIFCTFWYTRNTTALLWIVVTLCLFFCLHCIDLRATPILLASKHCAASKVLSTVLSSRVVIFPCWKGQQQASEVALNCTIHTWPFTAFPVHRFQKWQFFLLYI